MYASLIKALFVLTALTPVALVYAWVSISESHYIIAFWLLIASMVLVISCYFILKDARENLEVFEFSCQSIEPADQENLSFILLYLSPLFVDKVDNLNLNMLIPAVILYGLLMATSHSLHYNPLLSLMGWHFYKVSSTEGVSYLFLTTKTIKRIDRNAKVGQLTAYMLIDLSD